MTTIAIVAGGDLFTQFVPDITGADMVIGADRGALWLIQQGIVPDIALGDFDSISQTEKGQVQRVSKKTIVFPKNKDATDLELAADEAIRHTPYAVYIYGALGKRFDHSVGATHVLSKLVSHNIYGEIVDNYNKINIVRRKLILTKDAAYPYVSVLPFSVAGVTVTLTGFAYSLTRTQLTSGISRGISNEITSDTAQITVHDGIALAIRSVDPHDDII